jgi:anaerobic ribonucleoside-triphosphate reductase activating protein
VTVTGGEPFDQPGALAALLEGLTVMRRELPQPVDVLCYSGYPLSRLERRHPELLARADAVVSGPFVRARAEALPLRGSSNQRVTALTALGRDRYAGTATDDPAGPRQPRLQVAASPGTLWYIGIPAPGDMERLDAMMRDRGVRQQRVSWTA